MTKAPVVKLIGVSVVPPHFTGEILRHQKLSKGMEDTHSYLLLDQLFPVHSLRHFPLVQGPPRWTALGVDGLLQFAGAHYLHGQGPGPVWVVSMVEACMG